MRTVEAHVDIGHYSTALGGPEACVRAVANIDYSIRGAKGTPCVEVGITKFNMSVTDYMKAQIGLSVDDPSKRVLERWIVTFPNEATEDQCRIMTETFMQKFIGDSAAIGRCDFHFKPGNFHGHMHWIDGLETKASAKRRAAERDAQRAEGKKTRVRRRNHLRFKERYHRFRKTLGPDDPGVKMKGYLKQKWAEHVNAYCKEFGINVHFEHRSRAARGLPGFGTIHLGPKVIAMVETSRIAEHRESFSGVLYPISAGAIVAAERAQLRINHNEMILAKREEDERVQLNADAHKTQTEMHPVAVVLPVQSDIIVDIDAIKSSKASKPSRSLPGPDNAPLHPGILESMGIDTVDHSSKPRAPQHALAAQKTEKLVTAPIQNPQKSRPKVDHHKGFKKAVGDLSVALTVKPDRRVATNALARAAYHCSGAFEVYEQDDKISIIRQHVVKAARQLYDKFISSLSAVVRSKIFDRLPP